MILKGSPRNIILIVADSLRYDSVYQEDESAGLPYLESCAKQFKQVRSASCWTVPSTTSFFTGFMPHEHGVTTKSRHVPPEIQLLPERLRQEGYLTVQVTANVATTEVFGLHRGFDWLMKAWLEIKPVSQLFMKALLLLSKQRIRNKLLSRDALMRDLGKDLRASSVYVQNTHEWALTRTSQVLEEAKRLGKPAFVFVNLMEAHFPYHVAPTFRFLSNNPYQMAREFKGLFQMGNQTFLTKGCVDIPSDVLRVLRERQRKSWKLIRNAIDSFARIYHEDQDNLVIFTADHGENFGEQDWLYHFSNVTDAGTRVPLFWADPTDRKPEIVTRPTNLMFLHDAILESCGLRSKTGNRLFEPGPGILPLMESFWYDKQGRTCQDYKYNQICFLKGNDRFVMRNGRWLHAPVAQEEGSEPFFQPLSGGIDPVKETLLAPEERTYLGETLSQFSRFCETLS